MTEPGGLRHKLNLRMAAVLQKALTDDIPEDDETRVDAVSIRSPDLSTRRRISVTIRNFDPMRDKPDDALANQGDAYAVFKDWPKGMIGGQTTEVMRGTLHVDANLTTTREDKVTADRIVSIVMARAKHALRNASGIVGLTDEFGESVLAFRVIENNQYDAGSNVSNTTTDFLRWAALTLTARVQGA